MVEGEVFVKVQKFHKTAQKQGKKVFTRGVQVLE